MPEQWITPNPQAAAVPEVIWDDSVPSRLENWPQYLPVGQIAAAVQTLNEEVIENTQRIVIGMEKRYNMVHIVEVFEEGDLVRLKILV